MGFTFSLWFLFFTHNPDSKIQFLQERLLEELELSFEHNYGFEAGQTKYEGSEEGGKNREQQGLFFFCHLTNVMVTLIYKLTAFLIMQYPSLTMRTLLSNNKKK